MLTCRELTQILTDYTSGNMSFWRRLQVQMHLGMCKHCRTYLRQLRLTSVALGQVPPPPLDPETKAELLTRLASIPKKPQP